MSKPCCGGCASKRLGDDASANPPIVFGLTKCQLVGIALVTYLLFFRKGG